MNLFSVLRFECLYNIKKPHTYIFFALLIFQGVWYSIGSADLLTNKDIVLNAPILLYEKMALTGLIQFVVMAIIAAGGLGRDLEDGASHIVYPAIIEEKAYFVGKYLGVLLISLIITLGYPLGLLLYFPGVAPEQLGLMPWGQIMHGLLLFTLPNLIFLVTFAVFLVVIFRKSAAAYIGISLVLVFFLIAVSVRTETYLPAIPELMDPFALCSVFNIKEAMSVAEINTSYLPLTKTLLLNRLLWGLISVVLFVAAFIKFNFKTFIAQPSKKIEPKEQVSPEPVYKTGGVIPVLNYGTWSHWRNVFSLAWLDLKALPYSPAFWGIMGVQLFMYLVHIFFKKSTYFVTTSHLPLTSAMGDYNALFTIVLLLILAGELLLKDRTQKTWQIIDAMPTPSWVLILSRFLTLCVIAFCLASVNVVSGIFYQCCHGFFDIQWKLYLYNMYGVSFAWLTFVYLITFAFFCGAFFNNRLQSHVLSVVVFIFVCIAVDISLIEQKRFAFPFVPGMLGPKKYNYSEMNGYGVLDTGIIWYAGAWTALAAFFMLFSVFLWDRGVDRSWKERWQVVKRRLDTSGGKGLGAAMVCCLLLFGCFQYIIHDNLIHKAGYQTKIQKEKEAAAYEKKYAGYRQTPQPKITNLDLRLDLFPARRQAEYTARLQMKNTTSQPIETLHLDWERNLAMSSLSADGHSLEKLEQDEKLRHAIYRMQPPLNAGESMNIEIVGSLAHKGFQSDFQEDLICNGSVLTTDFLPFFGYDCSRELDNNKRRLRQGLTLLTSRMAGQDNGFSRGNLFESVQSDGLNWNMVISTDADQTQIVSFSITPSIPII